MRTLQFAFSEGLQADAAYLPHNHESDSVVYTGTHDNDSGGEVEGSGRVVRALRLTADGQLLTFVDMS